MKTTTPLLAFCAVMALSSATEAAMLQDYKIYTGIEIGSMRSVYDDTSVIHFSLTMHGYGTYHIVSNRTVASNAYFYDWHNFGIMPGFSVMSLWDDEIHELAIHPTLDIEDSYLDGLIRIVASPAVDIPDNGSTAVLLLLGVAGMAARQHPFRRKNPVTACHTN